MPPPLSPLPWNSSYIHIFPLLFPTLPLPALAFASVSCTPPMPSPDTPFSAYNPSSVCHSPSTCLHIPLSLLLQHSFHPFLSPLTLLLSPPSPLLSPSLPFCFSLPFCLSLPHSVSLFPILSLLCLHSASTLPPLFPHSSHTIPTFSTHSSTIQLWLHINGMVAEKHWGVGELYCVCKEE